MTGPRDFRPEDEIDDDPGASAAAAVDPTYAAGATPASAPTSTTATAVPTTVPAAPSTAPTATQTSGTAPGKAQPDPTTPLQDDSTRLDSTVTGPGRTGGPLYGDTAQKLAGLAHPKDAPKSNDYTEHYHHLNEDDYNQNQKVAHGKDLQAVLDGDISHNDGDRIKFGVEEPAKLKAANDAQNTGKQRLGQYASAINAGDIDAVGTADQILAQGAPGLAFFQFFAPAYNTWKGGGLTYAAAEQAYQAEYGMSFADYSSDAKLLADIGNKLSTSEQTLDNSYNTLVPTWQGAAASNFEAKMTVFFKATNTVTTDLGVVSKDIGALVHALQQLVLAKAQAVSELYAAELPTGIDGVMASSLVKVAMGEGDEQLNLIAFKLLSGETSAMDQFLIDFGLGGEVADKYAPRLATQWCNEILVPQFETREQALKTINAQTRQRIQQGFKEFTTQVSQVRDPYTGMTKVGTGNPAAPAPAQPPGGGGGLPGGGGGLPGGGGGLPGGGGGGVPGGGGSPAVNLPHVPTANPTLPASATGTTPQGTPDLSNLPSGATPGSLPGSVPGDPTGAGTRPAGLPPGSSWIPSGVPLPRGWNQDPTTGEALPKGWSTDPGTGLPTPPAGLAGSGGSAGGGVPAGLGSVPGGIDPKHDIHKNPDGSISLGPDRGLTIGREAGKKGVFTLSNTDADGTKHTYRVHFDEHGDPVVTEERPHDAVGGDPPAGVTSPAADLPVGGGGSLGGSSGGGVPGGGAVPGSSVVGTAGGGVPAGAGVGAPAAHAGPQLQDGTHVGADNATGTASDNAMSASGADGAGSPVAGSAAPAQGSGGGEQGGGFGGIPFAGAGRGGAGGGQEQESARRYAQRGDVVGEDDLEEWQRMGPVIGEP